MKFKLAFALHNHQPVGNFSAVFEEAHTKCYDAFISELKKYPELKISLHQSGILWDWQKQHHPEFFSDIGEMVDRGQVELLSGAFYEPILTVIPDRDKIGQLNSLNSFLKSHFEVQPRGMWLAERVWEPHLPRVINQCGLSYLPLDDTHFYYAGLREDQLYGSYITEEEGHSITLLPILKELRYLIPFGTPEKIIEFLRDAAAHHPGGMAVYADDGEKFGVWPETYKHCYADGWMERFLNILSENSDWLEVVSLGQAVEENPPLGRIYLPSASYSEMLHWALPADGVEAYEEFENRLKECNLFYENERFVRGGHWRGFLTKYPESNLMHKKMLVVSKVYEEVSKIDSIDPEQLAKARNFLYAGQCNCAYWHGVFGGLYLPHLRWAIYNKLIRAEKILRQLCDREIFYDFEDFDYDGFREIRLGNKELSITVSPHKGGQIIDWSCHNSNINLVDCMARRREGYHKKLLELHSSGQNEETQSIHNSVSAKENGLERLLAQDDYLRRPLTEHFYQEGLELDSFFGGNCKELGDFVNGAFEPSFVESDESYRLILSRRGHVWYGDFHCPLKLDKEIIFPKHGNSIQVVYRLLQNNLEIMPVNFAVEFDYNLLAPEAENRYVKIDGQRPSERSNLGAIDAAGPASSISLNDENQQVGIQIISDQSGKIWRVPIYSVSISESGFEKVYQGTSVLFLFDNSLVSGREHIIKFDIYTGPLDSMPALNLSEQPAVTEAK
ncbi:MAG: alpha-amylase/4-alpha-glucanotransferase domain-containing protein [candidate division Zixibacteria bacterium]